MEELNGTGESHDMENHIKETHAMLCDIEKDVHKLLNRGGTDSMGENFDSGMLAGLLSKQGVDPGIVAMMENARKDGTWGGDGGLLVLLFLIILMGGGGNGFWGNRNCAENSVEKTVFDQSNYDTLMSAVKGNRDAIGQLAQTLNCDVGQIQSALCGVDKQLAINNGDFKAAIMGAENNLSAQLAQCCYQQARATENQGCQTRATIVDQGAQTRELLQNNRFLIQATAAAQDNLVQSLFCQQNQLITDKFNALELRTLQDQNERLKEQIAAQSQAAQTAQILAAINGRNSVAVNGTLNTTAGTWAGNGQISSP
mgnify:CR=1 FL=1